MSRQHLLPTETVQVYARDGAVVLRGVLNADELRTLEAGIEHNLAHLSPLALVASEPDDPGRFVEDFCTWQANPDYQRILKESALPHLAAQLMQSRTARLYHDHLLVKDAGTRQPTPWHQDQPYYNVGGMQNVSFWIPVDPVPLASTLRFVAGSHNGTWYMPRTFRDQHSNHINQFYRHVLRYLLPQPTTSIARIAVHGWLYPRIQWKSVYVYPWTGCLRDQ